MSVSSAQQGSAVRALRRNEGRRVAAIVDGDTEVASRQQARELVHDRRSVRRVADHEELVGRPPIDDEVVDDPAIGIAGHRVLSLSDLERARDR